MPDLLLELFSEEIPARMQRKAAADLQKLVTDALVEAGLTYEGAKAFGTPRRLALTVHGLPAHSPDLKEETKGPPVGAPDAAIQGFLRKTGLASIDLAKIQNDKKKGDFYVAIVEKHGRAAEDVIAEIVPKIVRSFPWPKSMRWGASSAKPGGLTWVRPQHSILCVFGPETSETKIVEFEIDGIRSGNVTRGHRFLAPAPITVRRFDDYLSSLEKARVVLDADRRKQMILADARDRALAAGLTLVEDEALLEEVAGLVEWPVVLMGSFDPAFLKIPPEVIRTTIRANQKCFVLRDKNGDLAPRFILVANIEASDGGKAIVAGNERVIRARLSDARYFWETDLKTKLEDRLPKLDAIVFPRETRHAGRAGSAHCCIGQGNRAAGRSRSGEGRARRATRQGRSRHRDGRRVSRIAGPDGQVLRAGPEGRCVRRHRNRGSLQAARPERPRADRSGRHRGGSG